MSWLMLASGAGIWLPEARPCSCGNTIKVVTQSRAFCRKCIRPEPEERIAGYIDCVEKTFHEGVPRR